MKTTLILPVLFFIFSCGEANKPEPKPANTPAVANKPADPYFLPVPEGWTVEQFPIPIEFAPQVPYKGQEILRFTPGWGDTASAQHWSYFFLWWLEDNPSPDTVALQQHLTDYYNGLVGRNITQRKIPAEKLVTTKVSITKETAATGDLQTYTGTIYMLNYLKQTPITLHCRIHERKCGNHTALFFEISPREASDPIWEAFGKILSGFTCN